MADKIKKGLTKMEASELHQVGKISFPHVKQLLYPTDKPDGKGGQHFNLTQLSMETEIDSHTRISLDYEIVVFFEKPTTDFTHDKIFTRVIKRLIKMNIQFGSRMAKPIYLLYKEKEKNSK